MAETALVQSMCDTMQSSIDKACNTLLGAKAVTSPLLDALKRGLNNTSFSPPAALQNGLKQVSGLMSQVPNLSAVKGLGDFCNIMSSCTFFQVHDLFKNPVNLLRSAQSMLNTNFYGKILGIGSNLGLPELGLANQISNINKVMSKFRLDKLIPTTNLAITCISKVCNRDITATLRKYNLLNKAINLASGGALNTTEIYNLCNLSSVAISNMTQSVAGVASVMDQIDKSIAGGIAAIKRNASWCAGSLPI